MSLKIPKALKREFKKGFAEYTKGMGRNIKLVLKPYEVNCPNCIYDPIQKKSSNQYNTGFIRPVTIFPSTDFKRIVYPAPFNVVTASGVQFDPAILNPKILQVSICPVCKGNGILTEANEYCIKGVVDRGENSHGGTELSDLSGGFDGFETICIKTYPNNYSVCREAVSVLVDGIETRITVPPIIRGLGTDALVEFYVTTIKEDMSSSVIYDNDSRLNINETGGTSNQAPESTPTSPPNIIGDDDTSW